MNISTGLATMRAAVPTPLLPALVAARGRLDWSRPAAREDARAQMRFLLEHSAPDTDLDPVARAYLRYQALRGELRWHPRLLTSLRVEGIDHLREAQAQGRGVLLNFVHHGAYDGAFPSLARLGVPTHMVVYPYMLDPQAPAWIRQHIAVGTAGGGTAVSAAVGTDGLLGLLRRGEVLAIASDVPGHTAIRLFGREVLGSSGAARLPMTTGSPVVAFTSEEDERGTYIRVHEPLQPDAFATPEELLAAMLAIHETVLLRRPEAYDLPLSRWGAGERAHA